MTIDKSTVDHSEAAHADHRERSGDLFRRMPSEPLRETLDESATFGDLATLWLETKVDVKESTRACYQSLLKCSAADFWGLPIREISHLDVMAWVARLVSDRGFGPVQVHSAVGVMRATLELARRLGAIPPESNPADGVPLPRLRTGGGRLDRRLSLLELELLAREVGWWTLKSSPLPGEEIAVSSKGRSGWLRRRRTRCANVTFRVSEKRPSVSANRLEVLTRVLGYCGLRIGEALALTWRNVDWESGVFRVNRAVTEVGGRQVFDTPKNGRSRTVPIPKFLLQGDLARLQASFGSRATASAYLFPTEDGKNPLRASNLRYHFDLAAAAIGHPGLHIHDLRHTAASLAVSAGANVKAVAQMLGHSSAALTLDVYADLFAEDLSAVGSALDAMRRRELRRAAGA